MKNTGSAMNEPGQDPAPALQTAGCAAEELTPQRPAANASSSGQGQTEADQAIFTSIDSPRGGGYQLAAKSEGISLAEARELSAWGPSHDSLWETDEAAGSCNFHRLQSGRLAISRSIHGAAEYSGRGGRSVYTHYLVLSADDFARWDSNPFDVLRAASHTELTLEPVPQRLTRWQCELPGCSNRPGQIARLVEAAGGPLNLAAALDAVMRHKAVAFVGPPTAIEAAMEVLFLLLPEATRCQISFATGLKYSPRRPARWIGLHGDQQQRRRLARQYQFALVDLTEGTTNLDALEALSNLLQEAVQTLPCPKN